MASAWLLSRRHDVTLFEAGDYLGGHTHTHDVEMQGRRYAVDTGFIVHNPQHYPLLNRLFDELGVASQPTTMSFCGTQRGAPAWSTTPRRSTALFCQRRNLLFAAVSRHGARPDALLPRSAGPARSSRPRSDTGGVPVARGLRQRLSRRPPGADGVGAVVLAARPRSWRFRHAIWFSSWPTTRCCRSAAGPSGAWCAEARPLTSRPCAPPGSVDERLNCPVRAVHRERQGVRIDTDAGDRAVRPGRARLS